MSLSAGAAARDICPTRPLALFGYPHVERVSSGVHDPILASALFLDNGEAQLVLISLDILMLDPVEVTAIRQGVAAKLSISEWNVFVHTTHTHSGPVSSQILAWSLDPTIPKPDRDYLDMVRDRAIEAAVEASENREAAELAWAKGDGTGVGGNRISADGLTDPEVGILAVRAKSTGKLIGMVVNYGVHPTVMHEDSPLISSDFPHYTRVQLNEQYGDDLVVVYQMGPSGDQSPRHFVKSQTFEEAERIGRKLGRAVIDAVEKLDSEEFSDTPGLSAKFTEIELPRRKLPSLDEAEATLSEYVANYNQLKNDPKSNPADVRTAECAVFGAESSVGLAQVSAAGILDSLLKSYRPLGVWTFRIGPVWLVGLPGELFVEWALQIKRRADEPVVIASLVGGQLQGYLVTEEAVEAGGYEATNSVFSHEGGPILVETVLKVIGQ
jgi:Neutral/alkaline non-lysosomal ceramidase, N-terminal